MSPTDTHTSNSEGDRQTCEKVLNSSNQRFTIPWGHQVCFRLEEREIIIGGVFSYTVNTDIIHVHADICTVCLSLSHPHEYERLSFGLLSLWKVKVHLIPIKVGVIRRTHTLIKAKRPVRFHTRLIHK